LKDFWGPPPQPPPTKKRFLSNIFSEKNFEKHNFLCPLAADPLPVLIYYTFILHVGQEKASEKSKKPKRNAESRAGSVGL